MLIVILIENLGRLRVIRRINIQTLHPLAVLLLEQVERLPIFGVYQDSVSHLFQIVKTPQQAVGEVWWKVTGVQRQGWMCFKKGHTAFGRSPVA